MLTETARDMCLQAITNRAQTIKAEINRILNLVSFEEFATIVAEIPVSNDPDWDLIETPRENRSTWGDCKHLTAINDLLSRREVLRAVWGRFADALSPDISILDENDSQDERSDASSLARLVEMFRIHMERASNDGTARQACDMQRFAGSIQDETQSRNSLSHANHTSRNPENTEIPAVSLETRSHNGSVHLGTSRLTVTKIDESSTDLLPKDQSCNNFVLDESSARCPSDGLKTNLREHFIQQWNEAALIQSLFRLLKSQENGSTEARKRRSRKHRSREQRNVGHPLRQSITMEEYEARPDAMLGRKKYGRRVQW
ncbi:hypothetical protein LZ30DRAFT_592424 [Colletotrichum cereale]|nr:hypothetical protein LZ30DRAFT_592424 [Colletotrichum cereale]